MATSAANLRKKLARINAEKDCVAIFSPGNGVSFYIPDSFIELLKEGDDIPVYVWAVLCQVHIYQYFESDPTIKEFVSKIKKQILLDLHTEGNS